MNTESWTQKYEISSFLVNPQKRLGIYALLNLFQDVAWGHATQMGHGFESTSQKSTFWVLTRQSLTMNHWPKWSEYIEIKTWIRPVTGMYGIRDYEVYHDSKKIGECVASWLLLDADTRRPLKDAVKKLDFTPRTDFALTMEAAKVPILPDLDPIAEFPVRNSDLDINNHVNNTKYVQWILDSVPLAKHSKLKVLGYEINFVAETKITDVISIQKSMPADADLDEPTWIHFQGWRESDQKFVFAARLKVVNIAGS